MWLGSFKKPYIIQLQQSFVCEALFIWRYKSLPLLLWLLAYHLVWHDINMVAYGYPTLFSIFSLAGSVKFFIEVFVRYSILVYWLSSVVVDLLV